MGYYPFGTITDVVVVRDKVYFVDTMGFKELRDFKAPPEIEQKKSEEKEQKKQVNKPKR